MRPGLLFLVPWFFACAATGSTLDVPHFAADDPLVNQAGFVRETLRLNHEQGGTTYTLMAFRVGDVVTLGAMVQGGFDGSVEWQLGRSRIRLPFPQEPSDSRVAAEVHSSQPGAGEVVGQRASFQGTTWINVELDQDAWFSGPVSVQLTFWPRTGPPVFLPKGPLRSWVRFVPR